MSVEKVRTVFQGEDNVSPSLFSMVGAAQHALSAVGALQGVLGRGFATAQGVQQQLVRLAQMHSVAENTRMSITGTLRAYDMVGARMQDIDAARAAAIRGGMTEADADAQRASAMSTAFQQARGAASHVLDQIEEQAARLPGTAEQYVEVYRTALPAALGAGMRGLSSIATYTSNFAAVAAANQVDAMQSARDLSLMLRGQAGMDVRMWTVLQPLIHRTATDTKTMQAAQFNTMRASDRVEAIRRALSSYAPLLNEFENTWEARWSTMSSHLKQMLMRGTAPLFESMKGWVGQLNEYLDTIKPDVIAFGRGLSGIATTFGDRMIATWRTTAPRVDALIDRASNTQFARGLIGSATELYGAARTRLTGGREDEGGGLQGAAGIAAQFLMPMGNVWYGALMVFAENTQAVGAVLGHVGNIVNNGVAIFIALWDILAGVHRLLGQFLVGLLPGLWAAFDNIVAGVRQAVATVEPSLRELMVALGPVFQWAGEKLGELVTYLSGAFKTTLTDAAGMLKRLADNLRPMVEWLTSKRDLWRSVRDNSITQAVRTAADYVGNPLSGNWWFWQFNRTVSGAIDSAVSGAPAQTAGASADGSAQTETASGVVASSAQLFSSVAAHAAQNMSRASQNMSSSAVSISASTSAAAEAMTPWQRARSALASFIDRNRPSASASAVPENSPTASATPRQRGGTTNNFYNNRFDITQKFSEGFDPDRIVAVMTRDFEALADQRTEGFAHPAFSSF